MKCLRCGIPFSPSDIIVMEDWELPVCDLCDAEEEHFQVDYDGSEDFYEFISNKIKNITCNNCIRDKYNLVKLKYENPVRVEVKCTGCHVERKMVIYIKFV